MKSKKGKCLYCGNYGKMTKEHVFTKTIVKDFFGGFGGLGYRNDKEHYSFDNQTLKNVCEKCNNEKFSKLDNKMKKFLEINFHKKLLFKGDIVNFKYDFFDLTRWILKTLHNSYEKNGLIAEKEINFIYKYKDYIIGNTDDRDFLCYVEILRDPYLLEYPDYYNFNNQTIEDYKMKTRVIKISNLLSSHDGLITFISKMLTIGDFIFYIFDINKASRVDIGRFFNEKNIIAKEVLYDNNEIDLKVGERTFFDLCMITYEGNKLKPFGEYYSEYKTKKI